ncbi:hypothetical protein [Streptomyces sp. NPDC050535]|uniref:hypothetical protein n=1 Tax=Streptomyces sp. NPDC050535 TaxID=3365626 RepID=UPI0037ACA1AF
MTAVYPPWIIRYEGPGYCLSEAADTESAAYLRARDQAAIAEADRPLGITLRIGGQDVCLRHVGRIWILRFTEADMDYAPHCHSWNYGVPSTRALTRLPDDF